jgi:hypothetical protein
MARYPKKILWMPPVSCPRVADATAEIAEIEHDLKPVAYGSEVLGDRFCDPDV